MNDLQVFNNPEFGQVRTVVINNEPFFIAKDISNILGYSDAEAMFRRIDEEDQTLVTGQNLQNVGFEIPSRGLKAINESGLYAAVLSSKLPTAKKFKHWVTSEVLPSIRRTGSYGSNTATINNTLEFISPILDEAGITAQQKYRIVKGILKQSGIIIPDIILENKKNKAQSMPGTTLDVPMKIAERFLNEACIMDEQSLIAVSDLFNLFIAWCKENGVTALSKTMLGRKLHSLGIGRQRGKYKRYWVGIKAIN